MADRILTWYLEELTGNGTNQGPTFCLDKDYKLPGVVRIHAGIAPDAEDLEIDIKDDGVSIFTNRPALQKNQNGQDWWEDFNQSLALMEKYSWISLDVVGAGAKQITVQLELTEELKEDDEEDEEDV